MLRACWLSLHAMLAVAVVLVALPIVVKTLAMAAVAACAWLYRPLHVDTAHIVLEADGVVRIVTAAGDSALPDAASRITAYWLLLTWRGPCGRREWLVLADQLDDADWARLSARLRRSRDRGSELS